MNVSVIEWHGAKLPHTSLTVMNMILLSEAQRRYDLSSLKIVTCVTEFIIEQSL